MNYLVRVELHGAVYDDYQKLHKFMESEGFTRTIVASDGISYQLPTAEYHGVTTLNTNSVLEVVQRAVKNTGKTGMVLVNQYSQWMSSGLVPVR